MRTLRQGLLPSLSLTMCALALAAPSRAAAYNYVTNGGFEDGVEPWTVWTAAQFSTIDSSEIATQDGARSGKITLLSGTAPFALRQTSWLGAPAGSYHVSAWVRTASAGTEASIEVTESPSGNTLRLARSGLPNQWQHLEGDIAIVGLSNLAIAIGGAGAAGDVIYVDDVRIDGAAPATMTPTATATPGPSVTPSPSATPTRTLLPTKTAAATKTPRPTTTPPAAPGITLIGTGLTNAGFEAPADDGSPAAWQKYGGVLSSADAPVRSGRRAARFESATDSTKWLYQTVLVEGGTSYEFGAWIVDGDSGVAAAFLRVSWYASDDGGGSALGAADSTERLRSASPEYRYLTTGAIAASVGAHSARLRIMFAPVSASPAAIYADDAFFAPADQADAPVNATASDVSPAEPSVHRVLGESSAPGTGRSVERSGITSTGRLLINEVMFDPDGVDDTAAEWVELYNASDVPVSLAAWSLADAASNELLADALAQPHGYVVIAASDSFYDSHPGFGGTVMVLGTRIGNGLGNDGDRLSLRDPAGALADAISWGTDTSVLDPPIADVPAGHSIERRNVGIDHDSADDFVDNLHPSPGGPFVAAAAFTTVRSGSDTPQTLVSGRRSFRWLTWSIVALAAVGLAAALSWRAVPALTQRIRHHA